MSFKTTAAPCTLLLAALTSAGWASPAFARQTPEPAVLDSVLVTGRRNAEDPAVVADARARP